MFCHVAEYSLMTLFKVELSKIILFNAKIVHISVQTNVMDEINVSC